LKGQRKLTRQQQTLNRIELGELSLNLKSNPLRRAAAVCQFAGT